MSSAASQARRLASMMAAALAFSTYQLFIAAFSPLSSQVTRSLHVGFLLLLTYLLYPARKAGRHHAHRLVRLARSRSAASRSPSTTGSSRPT